MITLKTVAHQTVLLLTIGLLAPLHGSAPACGGAGGEDYAAPAASTRRGAPSASEVMVENDWLRMCNEKQKTLETQFPGILTGAIPSEPQPITEAQLTALNDARLEIVDATNNINEGSMPDCTRTLHAYGKLVDDVVKALLQVKMPRSGFDIAALASQLDAYNTVQKRRVPKLHDTLEIDGDLNYSFSANQLKTYITSPAIAQYAERTSLPEPAANDAPAERLASLHLADNITVAMRSVFLTDTSDDAMELKQVITAYNKARNLRIRLSPEQRLPNQARCLISHFLPAADQLALAQTSRQWGESFQQTITSIASKIRISHGVELTDDERMLCAQPIIKTSQQPDTEGFYNISLSTEDFYGIPLPIAMKLLTKAIIANDAAKIAILKPLVEALIDQHHAQYLIAFDNAKTALEINAPPPYLLTGDTDLLATMDKGDLLKHIALCFASYHYFSHTYNMKPNIRLDKIITKRWGFNTDTLNFASIKELPDREAIAQLIIDFVLSLIKPTSLIINESYGAVTVVSNCLRDLIAIGNHQLKTLNVSNCPQLNALNCDNSSLLTALDFSNCPRLQNLSTCNNPLLTALDVSPCPQLKELRFDACPLLTVLGLSNCSQLKKLSIGRNPWLTTLDLSNCTKLQSLECPRCPLLTGLDLSMCPKLAWVDISHNPLLTALDLSNFTKLHCLEACGNPCLTTLDLSNCTKLTYLEVDCSNKRLTHVNLENTPHLFPEDRNKIEDIVADNIARK